MQQPTVRGVAAGYERCDTDQPAPLPGPERDLEPRGRPYVVAQLDLGELVHSRAPYRRSATLSPVSPTIRAPRPDELDLLRDIERSAGQLFVDAGLDDIAAHEPETVENLAAYLQAGRAWVVVAGDGATAGYAVVDVVDGLAHLEQISVRPEYGGKGLGAALLEWVCAWAAQQHFAAVTLTTFSDLPFNAPFYAHHGFAVIDDDDLGPELRALRATEAAHGLDPARRVCMRRAVHAA